MTKTEICPICGNGSLHTVTGDFQSEFEDQKSNSVQLVVPNVTWQHCDSCGEEILDNKATQAISSAQRKALGLLTPDELKDLRRTLGKSQEEMCELLGIGKKTFCRWESGTHFQTEAFDRYLRLLQVAPSNVAILQVMKKTPKQAAQSQFRYLKDPSVYESTCRQFLSLLEAGPFNQTA